ncbi:MAG: Phenylalanyl-tRNA synthetase beta subunit, partial [uncultured bacterium]
MVAVAKVGAVLPNGIEIKAVKLRGEESCGMLCSAKELELHSATSATEDKPGILELSQDAPIGKDFRA